MKKLLLITLCVPLLSACFSKKEVNLVCEGIETYSVDFGQETKEKKFISVTYLEDKFIRIDGASFYKEDEKWFANHANMITYNRSSDDDKVYYWMRGALYRNTGIINIQTDFKQKDTKKFKGFYSVKSFEGICKVSNAV